MIAIVGQFTPQWYAVMITDLANLHFGRRLETESENWGSSRVQNLLASSANI